MIIFAQIEVDWSVGWNASVAFDSYITVRKKWGFERTVDLKLYENTKKMGKTIMGVVRQV